jgi:hypothetical protein
MVRNGDIGIKVPKEIKWKIDAYTAETMPLDRLLAYVGELAKLLAPAQQHLHLLRVESGSTVPVLRVDPDFPVEEIHIRSRELAHGVAPKPATRSYLAINRMLREDNAKATLYESEGDRQAEIIMFPGAEEAPPLLAGLKQAGNIDGRLERIGGAKEWVPMRLRTLDGDWISRCYAKRSLAKEIGHHLFEPMRLYGRGTWSLSSEGHWNLDSFHVDTFDILSDKPLVDVVRELRAVKADWVENPVASILSEADE